MTTSDARMLYVARTPAKAWAHLVPVLWVWYQGAWTDVVRARGLPYPRPLHQGVEGELCGQPEWMPWGMQ